MPSSVLDKRIVSLTAPSSMEAEQYQTLRLKLEYLQRERDCRVIGVSSPGAREGKTVTSINLAGTLARDAAKRVLLIEADLRRPSVARYLGLESEGVPGLTQVVRDPSLSLKDAIRVRDTLTFDVMLAGSVDAPVDEVCRSPRLRALLEEARRTYHYVILDTPPLGPVADGAILAQSVDGLLLVVAAHHTPRKALEEALNLLDCTSVLGIIFNGDDRPLFGYRKRYRYQYFSNARPGRTTALNDRV
jgi:succinoglycan biosynthesis transport protein ExoP